MKVHELATELSMESRQLIRICHRLEILVKNQDSVLDEEEVEQIRAEMAPRQPEETATDAPAEEAGTEAPEAEAEEAEAKEAEADTVEAAESASTEGADETEEGDRQPTAEEEGRQKRGRGKGPRGRGRSAPLSQDDPYWQFGTPVEYWGSSRGGTDTGGRDPSGLAPEDPYWQVGSPPDSWGSTRKKSEQPNHGRPKVYLECRTCGVKIEKKRAHGDRKVKCPFCSRWMREVK